MSRSTQVPEPSLSLSNTGLSPSLAELSCSLLLVTRESVIPALQPRTDESARFGLFPVRSPLLRKSMFLSFPPPTKMFQFRGLAHFRVTGLLPAGLSHSEILGSILVCKSPRLIAAYHVFLRLQEPRHPPYALYYFLTFPISPIVVIGTLSHLLKYVNERRKFTFAVNSTRFEPTPKAVLL